MDKVVKAIHEGQNALLESPTGTGKTMCLLTAALAVLKKE
jgi:regulator of telomere elongation helicase 1